MDGLLYAHSVCLHFAILSLFQAAFLAIKSTGGKLLVFQSGKLVSPYKSIHVLGVFGLKKCVCLLSFLFLLASEINYTVFPSSSFSKY